MDLIILVTLVVVGYLAGTVAEKKHYASIRRREAKLLKLPAITMETLPQEKEVQQIALTVGTVCISMDYFKKFVCTLKKIFGGRLGLYETLLDRARREAVLRMKENVPWADMIVNVRLESTSIGAEGGSRRKNKIHCIEILAFGTAVAFKK